MKPLILRDLRAYGAFFAYMILTMILYALLILKVGNGNGLVGFLVVFVPSITGVVLFVGDQELIQHIAALPVTRTQMVLAKYLSTYLYGTVMLGVTIGITWLVSRWLIGTGYDLEQLLTLRGLLFAILPMLLIVHVAYPLLFRFGLSVGVRIVLGMFALLYGVGILVMERLIQQWLHVKRHGIFANAMALFEYVERQMGRTSFYILLIGSMGLLVAGSILLSVYWMRRRDLG